MNGRRRERSASACRWAILLLSSVAMAGVYYSLDIPASLHQQLRNTMSPTENFETRFNLLFSVYALPNTVLPLIGGNIVDRLGAYRSLVGFTCFALIGQVIFAVGTGLKCWPVMLIGRVVYGLGGESTCVAGSTILSSWFVGGEQAFACSLFLASGRMGSVLNNLISPTVANASSTPVAMWVGLCINVIAAGASIVASKVERCEARKIQDQIETEATLTALLLDDDENSEMVDEDLRSRMSQDASAQRLDLPSSNEREDVGVHVTDVRNFTCLFWLLSLLSLITCGCVFPFNNVASGILLERNYFRDPPADCKLLHPDQCSLGTLQNFSNPAMNKSGIECPREHDVAPVLPRSLNITDTEDSWEENEYVFDSVTAAVVDCGDPFWSRACTQDYCDAQDRATEKAGRVMSIPYLLSAISAPFLGRAMDSVGSRAAFATVSPILLMSAHSALAISRSSPILPLLGQGIAYSFFAAVMWPSIPLSVESKYTGTAFGVVTANINIATAVFPLVIASIYNSDGHRYIPRVEYFFVTAAILGFAVALCLNLVDSRTGGKLNQAPNDIDTLPEPDISSLVSSENANYIT